MINLVSQASPVSTHRIYTLGCTDYGKAGGKHRGNERMKKQLSGRTAKSLKSVQTDTHKHTHATLRVSHKEIRRGEMTGKSFQFLCSDS